MVGRASHGYIGNSTEQATSTGLCVSGIWRLCTQLLILTKKFKVALPRSSKNRHTASPKLHKVFFWFFFFLRNLFFKMGGWTYHSSDSVDISRGLDPWWSRPILAAYDTGSLPWGAVPQMFHVSMGTVPCTFNRWNKKYSQKIKNWSLRESWGVCHCYYSHWMFAWISHSRTE